MADIHTSALEGFSQASSSYVSGRPGYPEDVDRWLAHDLGLGSGKTAVDLGAGTGKFTRHLLATGAKVWAVEPVAEMLEKCQLACPAAITLTGHATDMPLESESVDAVCCAQAFHWFATQEAVQEVRRVLKPGGMFGLIWNIRDETCPWVAELSRIMQPYEEGTPRFHEGQWRAVFPAPGFSDLQERELNHSYGGSFDQVVVDRVLSVSFIAALSKNKRSAVRQEIHAMRPRYSALANERDVGFPYRTLVAWTRKLPG